MQPSTITIGGVDLEVFEGGTGRPLLFLHSGQGFDPDHAYVAGLTDHFHVIAPSHPGFGKSALPDWMDNVDDVAYLYIELLDHLGHEKVDAIGCSIGGWIAAEMATKVPERIERLILVGPVGVKTGTVDQLDIPDIFAKPPEEVQKLLFHDPEKFRMDPASMTDDQLATFVRNRESLAFFGWEPYLHNPKLKHRLHRARMPSLLIRGESDGVVSSEYLERYAALLPDARITTIPEAGHAPQIEQPDRFNDAVRSFHNA